MTMITSALVALAATGQVQRFEPAQTVQRLHSALISRFEDLAATEKAQFGVNRVEMDAIGAHGRKWTSSVNSRELQVNAFIYGNRGKPLDPAKLIRRYTLNINYFSKVDGVDLPTSKEAGVMIQAMARKTAQSASSKDFKGTSDSRGKFYIEGRPIRLTKPECLKCHSGMKQNDPVAVVVYILAPAPKTGT